MKVRLLLNIGTRDAPRLGLDPVRAREGDVVDVDAKAAEEMTRRGWATDKFDPPKVSAPAKSEPSEDFDAMTKEDLKAHAELHKIPGVTAAMSKDDLLKLVKKFTPGA